MAQRQKYILLIVSMFSGVLLHLRIFNPDCYFLLAYGRYVAEKGFPHVDPFSMHEGLHFVMQQWLSAMLFWQVYGFGGIGALTILVYVMAVLLIGLYFCLLYTVSRNVDISAVISLVVGILISFFYFVTERPQIFSTALILLELLVLETYARRPRKALIAAFPVLSILLMNLHAPMWWMLFVVMLPYVVEAALQNRLSAYFHGEPMCAWSFPSLMLVVVLSFAAGFCNPYGMEAMTYLFHAYGLPAVDAVIREMDPVTWPSLFGKLVIFSTIFLTAVYARSRMPLRYYLLALGFTLLAFMHERNIFLYLFVAPLPLAYVWRQWKGWSPHLSEEPGSIRMRKLNMSLLIAGAIVVVFLGRESFRAHMAGNEAVYIVLFLCIAALCSFLTVTWKRTYPKLGRAECMLAGCVLFVFLSFTTVTLGTVLQPDKENLRHLQVERVLQEDATPEASRIYATYGVADYLIFHGWKPYLDARAEVYTKGLNQKEDILLEWVKLKEGFITPKEFVEKHQFTHLVTTLEDDLVLYTALANNPDYELLWDSEKHPVTDKSVYAEGTYRIYKRRETR